MRRQPSAYRDLLIGYHTSSSVFYGLISGIILALIALFLVGYLPEAVFRPESPSFIFVIGGIGIWRYSWAFTHYCRASYFKFVVFPKIRKKAEAENPQVPYYFFVVASYQISAGMNAAVYGRLLEEIADNGGRAMIVAGVTDPADVKVLQQVLLKHRERAPNVVLVPIYQSGKGKREIVAEALDFIATRPRVPGSQVVLMDGDTLLGRGCLKKAASVLQSNPDLGAVTTENIPMVKGSMLHREWYRLRMAQRAILMSSLSLSRKVLVLTGRLSFFRVEIALQPDFIASIRSDSVNHWRLQRISLLTGEDKSTWYCVLKKGWNMMFIPDAVAHPLEEMPVGNFFLSSVRLMSRWYGNMIRANGRALALGPARTGAFLWACLLDQRLSMWTSLIGPTFTTLLAVFCSPVYLAVYVLWILISRSILTLSIMAHTGKGNPLFVPLLYYSQLVGSAVKVFMSFHPYRQKWTRQNIAGKQQDEGLMLFYRLSSYVYNCVAVLAFVIFVFYVGDITAYTLNDTGLVDAWNAVPDFHSYQ